MIDTVGLLDCVTACFCIVEAAGRDQMGWIVGRIINPGFAPFPSFLLRMCNVDLNGSQTQIRPPLGPCRVEVGAPAQQVLPWDFGLTFPKSFPALLGLPYWPLSVKTAHLLCWMQAFRRCKCDQGSRRGVMGDGVLFLFRREHLSLSRRQGAGSRQSVIRLPVSWADSQQLYSLWRVNVVVDGIIDSQEGTI